jgi:hypothetical protein
MAHKDPRRKSSILRRFLPIAGAISGVKRVRHFGTDLFWILSCAGSSDGATFRKGIPTLGPKVAYEINQSFQSLAPFDQIAANYELRLRDSDGPHRGADAGVGRHHSDSSSASGCSGVTSAIAFLT